MNEMLLWSISCISIGFCFDLIKTIKSPFERFEGRLSNILISVYLGNFLLVLYSIILFHYIPNIQSLNNLSLDAIYDRYYRPIVTFVQIFEVIVAIYSLIISIFGLFK